MITYNLPKWWVFVCAAIGAPFFMAFSASGDIGREFAAAILFSGFSYIASLFWGYRKSVTLWFVFALLFLIHIAPLMLVSVGRLSFPGILFAPIFAFDAIIMCKILEWVVKRQFPSQFRED